MPTEHRVSQRDVWLARSVDLLRPFTSARGLVLPDHISIGVGDTHRGESGLKVLGFCYQRRDREPRQPEITIYEGLRHPIEILGTVVHELIHAADGYGHDHDEWFQAWARALGLEGHPGTWAGRRLTRELYPIARALGVYPSPGPGFLVDHTGRLVA